jgi:hypothetical protein
VQYGLYLGTVKFVVSGSLNEICSAVLEINSGQTASTDKQKDRQTDGQDNPNIHPQTSFAGISKCLNVITALLVY